MISYCYRNNEHQDQYNGNTHGYSCPDPPFKTSFLLVCLRKFFHFFDLFLFFYHTCSFPCSAIFSQLLFFTKVYVCFLTVSTYA